MSARVIDNKHQVKDLGFSDYFQTEFTKIRCNVTGQLRTDLTRLMNDHLHNSKYERFGEIITRFLHSYLKATIKWQLVFDYFKQRFVITRLINVSRLSLCVLRTY